MSSRAPTRWGPRWSRWVGRGLARIYWNTEVRGRENMPRKGAAIVVVNHVGFIDGPVVHGVIPRLSYFLIRADMFKGPLKPLLTWAAQIPVSGDGRSAPDGDDVTIDHKAAAKPFRLPFPQAQTMRHAGAREPMVVP